jgi:hypothetical protein
MAIAGDELLVIDERQPVALLLDNSGRVRALASWPHHEPPLQTFLPDRRRTVVVTPGSTRVVDGQHAVSAKIYQRGHTLHVAQDSSDVSDGDSQHGASLFQPIRRISNTDVEWTFSIVFDGPRVTTLLTRSRRPQEVRRWDLGAGSATDAVILGETLYFCIRRAHRRPWDFAPQNELWQIAGDVPTLIDTSIDISKHCWPRRPYIEEDLARALDRATDDARVVVGHGATHVSVVVEDLEILPRIRLFFTMPDHKAYVRSDHPFDELGCSTGGLDALGIILAEDVDAGLSSAYAPAHGPIPI